MRDEGGPFGVGFQERAPNHSKLLRSKAVVVSVGGQSVGDKPEPVVVRETTERKPSLTRRKEKKLVVKTKGVFPLGTSLPGTWLLGRRRPAWRGRDSDLGSHAEPREPEW